MIRKATKDDAEILYQVESTCFPANEGATKEEIQKRLTFYANPCLLLFENNKLVSFIEGVATNEED